MSTLRRFHPKFFDHCLWFIFVINFFFPEHVALHTYTPQQDGDLAFSSGDTVIVFEMLANGWWRGCSAENEGWFPNTYVEVQYFCFFKKIKVKYWEPVGCHKQTLNTDIDKVKIA